MDTLFDFNQSYQTIILSSVAVLLAIIVQLMIHLDRRIKTVPGPRGYPLIGIGYQLPSNTTTLFRKWALEYGDVFTVRVGWYNWVVLNSPHAIREVLEKQSLATSSKAPSPMGHDIVTGGNRMPTMPYGPTWRALRTIIRQVTTVPMTNAFKPTQEFEMQQLLYDLATANTNERGFYQHMRRYAFSIIMTIAFGRRAKSMADSDVASSVQTQAILRRTSRPGAFAVDEIPILALLPKVLQPGRRAAMNAAKEVSDIKMRTWQRLVKDVESGSAPHCYARQIYENRESWYSQGLSEEHLIWVTTGLVEAGFETTAATLNTLVLYLAANPRVQEKADEELMRVVGPNRLPTFEDMPSLPYVRACVKEALRMNPILSPGIRHYTEQDIVFEDHVIPKGTVLLANTAVLHFDPARFERPFEFIPERYIEHHLYSSEYAAMGDPYKRDHFTFSAGRRTCPGARLAENSLDIALAGIMWAFNVRPPLQDGVEMEMCTGEESYLDAGFTIPKPFAARFVPKTQERRQAVEQQWKSAADKGYEMQGAPVDVDGVVL